VEVDAVSRLGEATEAFQVYTEAVRAHPDDELLAADLAKAKREMEVEWLKETVER
jgi:hypothetical protein